MTTSRISRIFKITHVCLVYRLFEILPTQYVPWYIKLLSILTFWYPKKLNGHSKAYRLRMVFETLGPVWIKLGQMLSTRRDLFPPEYANELSHLQDKIAPFSTDDAISIILKELNITELSDVFDSFSEQPIATASIAQVHGAKLKNSVHEFSDVVVKVIRPGIERDIHADLKLMRSLADIVHKRMKDSERYKPKEVVREYEKTILLELNLKQEAENGIKLRNNFKDSDELYIPYIHDDLCTKSLLIMERIDGIPVSDIDALIEQGTDLEALAARGVRVFFTQVFRDSFFHADMHPGNIFISKQNPTNPNYIGVDFGIVGTLNDSDKRYLAENFVAFFNRNYRKVAELHVQSGWVPNHVNIDDFEQAIKNVCDPIFNKPLAEISFAQVLIGLFDTARQFEMQVQPQLVLLQKTLLYIEGLGRQLYPQLDLWQTAKPFLESWINEQIGFKAFYNKSKSNMPFWLEKAPEMPEAIFSSLQTLSKLPSMQESLIKQYGQFQQKQRRFFVVLASFCISTISSVATFLLANLTTLLGKGVLISFIFIALISTIKLRNILKS